MTVSIFHYQFIQNAFFAGSCIAILAGAVGYFLVTRGLTFAGHALSHIGFAGAAAALVFSVDPFVGLLIFTIIAGIGIGMFGERVGEGDIGIGSVLTFMLGLGSLFIALYSGYAEQAYSVLFGTILGITSRDVTVTVIVSIAALLALAAIFRPLLFSSIDPEVAEARGVPVRTLGIVFLVIVALAVSVSVEVVGVLLIFTLLIGPAATAVRLVKSPAAAIVLSMVLGLIYVWAAILLAALGSWPVSFWIAAISFAVYLPVRIVAKPETAPEETFALHVHL